MMIPFWYAACLMLGAGVAGYLCSQLWPIVTATHLTRLRTRTLRQVAELRRLTAWTPPTVHWEAGIRDDWSLPVSPRLTDRDRIEAAKAAAIEVAVDVAALAVRHAAPPPDVDFGWHRGEHRIYSWGWAVEVVARLLNFGKTFLWDPAEHPLPEGRHAAWNIDTQALDITGEFRRIMATEFGSHRCDSCTVGRDGEPQHVSCVGCSCPCGAVEPLPEGVDGYAIAGRTR